MTNKKLSLMGSLGLASFLFLFNNSHNMMISENVEALTTTKIHIVGDRWDENPIVVDDPAYTSLGYMVFDWNDDNWKKQWINETPLSPICKGDMRTGRPNSTYCSTKLEHFDYWE